MFAFLKSGLVISSVENEDQESGSSEIAGKPSHQTEQQSWTASATGGSNSYYDYIICGISISVSCSMLEYKTQQAY